MCFHWQQRAADKLYDELQAKSIDEVKAEIEELKLSVEKHTKAAHDYHKPWTGQHGFFSGMVYGAKLCLAAAELVLKEKEDANKN